MNRNLQKIASAPAWIAGGAVPAWPETHVRAAVEAVLPGDRHRQIPAQVNVTRIFHKKATKFFAHERDRVAAIVRAAGVTE